MKMNPGISIFFLCISTDGSHIVNVRKFAVLFLKWILFTVLDLTNLFLVRQQAKCISMRSTDCSLIFKELLLGYLQIIH